ncbi:MAG: cytochrome P450 [Methylocystis sp.]|uniref:cytochrome P450 n=1 Tax=Methylocystis sp. TaxID=1911079 RepID=UPI003DA5D5FE
MSFLASSRSGVSAPRIPAPERGAMAKIPGSNGWPIVGNTLEILADPKGVTERSARQYGRVYRAYTLGAHTVTLLGPEANEFVFLDEAKVFSSALGWGIILERLFPGGLMLLDFDEHRLHRKALSVAFKAGPMKAYLASLNAGVAGNVVKLRATRGLRFYPTIKAMTLDLAATSFLGAEIGPDLDRIKQAYIEMVAATVSVVRRPIPGTQMYRGVKARAAMVAYFQKEIGRRRASAGTDLFTELCKATMEDGALLSAQEVADHMNFLMMAAHDTLASSLTSFVYFLAVNTQWQERLRDEILGLGLARGEPLPYERLRDLPLVEMAFNECLRLIPPAPSVLRCALRDVEFGGHCIPAGACVAVSPLYTHHMPEHWPQPETFDPLRFTPEASRDRHKYAFTPFGGGAHMCLGLHFAYMQAKCFAYHLLSTTRLVVPPDYRPGWKFWPIPQPRDGLRVSLEPL